MLQLIKNVYFILFLILYVIAVVVLNVVYKNSLADMLTILAGFGIIIPFAAWLLTKNSTPGTTDKPSFTAEPVLILLLVFFFSWYVTYGSAIINKLIPQSITLVEWKNSFAIFFKKIIVFVLVPFLIYKATGFSLKDFGFVVKTKTLFSRKTLFIFITLSVLILLYQYFFSGGARPVRDGVFTTKQFIIGLPLTLIWLFFEAGLIEEFFFRTLLQSRIAVLLRSPVAGIVISGLIFGLAHAPGLYLRGADSEGISEQLPFGFWACYTVSAMSLAGIFLGIVWQRTRNIWLVMALHAVVDLLPNFGRFVHTWGV